MANENKKVYIRTLRKALSFLEYDINSQLHDEAFTDDAYVRIYINIYHKDNLTPNMAEMVNLEINWGALGSVSPKKAEAYGRALIRASEAVRNFKYNGYEVSYKEVQ